MAGSSKNGSMPGNGDGIDGLAQNEKSLQSHCTSLTKMELVAGFRLECHLPWFCGIFGPIMGSVFGGSFGAATGPVGTTVFWPPPQPRQTLNNTNIATCDQRRLFMNKPQSGNPSFER